MSRQKLRYPPGWKPTPTLPHVARLLAEIAPTKKRNDIRCHCGALMRLIDGPYGRFYGCRRWPDCNGRIRAAYDGAPLVQLYPYPTWQEHLLRPDPFSGDELHGPAVGETPQPRRRTKKSGHRNPVQTTPECYLRLADDTDEFEAVAPGFGLPNVRHHVGSTVVHIVNNDEFGPSPEMPAVVPEAQGVGSAELRWIESVCFAPLEVVVGGDDEAVAALGQLPGAGGLATPW